MFSGLVEHLSHVRSVCAEASTFKIHVERPRHFTDVEVGHSLAVDGVCLTVQSVTDDEMVFVAAFETLRVVGWSEANLLGRSVNLERSLRLGDRMHGHWVTGHVDGVGVTVGIESIGSARLLKVQMPEVFLPYVWKKGSLALNGVSLTINEVSQSVVEFGLIPETLKATNLGHLKLDDRVNVELDSFARGVVHWISLKDKERK